jgi:GNAT superfamily N-acetyltransferase
MHVTVLRTSNHVLSALVGVVGRRDLHVAILAHSPFHARHSPGKFHLMFAGLDLAPAGFRHLDLTPGGTWKERFADTYDQVYEVRIHPSRAGRLLAASRGGVRRAAKRLVVAVGLDPGSLAGLLATGSRRGLRATVRLARRHVKDDVELRVYARPLGVHVPPPGPGLPPGLSIRRDSVQDLLKFHPVEPGPSRKDFLSAALGRLEDGEHVLTVCDDQRLLHHGWVRPADGDVMVGQVGQVLALPDVAAVLHDFYTDPVARGRGHCGHALDHALRELAPSGSGKRVLTWVLADDRPARRAVERAGFSYLGSLGRRRRLWRDVRWRTVPDVPSADEGAPR